jgi:pyruvate formate lyase activating enzyme
MKETMLYEKLEDGKVKCATCAHRCLIKPGKRGICTVRENMDGTLMSIVYGKLISMNADPIEKKPLFHFQPGSRSLSIATVGCNFRCEHCQNWEISQYLRERPDALVPGDDISPQEVVDTALKSGCEGISYTYTEPTIFLEFAYETARLAHEKGIKNVFVSNGFMTPESAKLIAPYLDGDNIDLKGDSEFYKKICHARLDPVKETIVLMKELGVWLEITTLVIPGHNDSDEVLEDIAGFIASVDTSIPWHVSRFSPAYRLTESPPTPVETLERATEIGRRAGIKYIYEGNVPGMGGESTYCPVCGEMLIERVGFRVIKNSMKDGNCFKCGTAQPGLWL